MKKIITRDIRTLCAVMLLSGFMACPAYADFLDDAQRDIDNGQYYEALDILATALKNNPKLSRNARYLYLKGVCELKEGNLREAETLLKSASAKGNHSATMYLGEVAIKNYDFEGASDYFEQYRKQISKSKKEVSENLEDLERALEIAESAFDRVEKITVLDSLSLPFNEFETYYKLPKSAGSIVSPEKIPFKSGRDSATLAFINEAEDYIIWSETDKEGRKLMKESYKLLGSGWQEPVILSEEINEAQNPDYPFMMPDGVTLYFAAEGENSMGGYDIFVAQKDANDGSFRQPLNLGMPFNSPYNDYMMAIDEENGVGWWATDRNAAPGMVTVYIYKLNDLRKNYDAEEEDLTIFASLSDYRRTQDGSDHKEINEILQNIRLLQSNPVITDSEFIFPISKDIIYYHFSDFRNKEASKKMKAYVSEEESFQRSLSQLSALRKQYHGSKSDELKRKIISLEATVEKQRIALAASRSEIYKLEKSVLQK